MRATILLLGILVVSCSSNQDDKATGPTASLEITFGTSAPVTITGDVTSDATSSRSLIHVTDGPYSVMISLSTPLVSGHQNISGDVQSISIWAKKGSGQPLVGTSGIVDVLVDHGNVALTLTGIAKAEDQTGESLAMSGAVKNVPAQ